MYRFISCFLIFQFFSHFPCAAQNTTETAIQQPISVDIQRTDPHNTGLWAIGISPVNLYFSKLYGINVGCGGQAEYNRGAQFGFSARYVYQYVNALKDGDTYTINTDPLTLAGKKSRALPTDFQDGINLEVSTWYGLFSKTKPTDISLHFGGKRKYAFVQDSFLVMPGLTANTLVLRTGALVGKALAYVKASPSGFESQVPEIELADVQTMISQTTLSIGVGWRSSTDYKAAATSVIGQQAKQQTAYRELYMDALFSPSTAISDVDFYSNEMFSQRLDLGATKTNPVGFRIGFRGSTMNRWFGSSMYIEGGAQPGLKVMGRNLFVRMGYAFLFGGRAR